MDVSVTELRAHLRDHLRRVQGGAELTVTHRGRAIARIGPVGARPIDRLIREGVVTRAEIPKRGGHQATDMWLERRGRGLVAVSSDPLPLLSSDVIRETLEETRRGEPDGSESPREGNTLPR